jgi:hypothetical protein
MKQGTNAHVTTLAATAFIVNELVTDWQAAGCES